MHMRADAQAHSACGPPWATQQECRQRSEFLSGGEDDAASWEKAGPGASPGSPRSLGTGLCPSGSALEGWLCWEVGGANGVRERV